MQLAAYRSNLQTWQKINSGSTIESIENLHPGDKLFIKSSGKKPECFKTPEVLTIRKIDVAKKEIYLKEIGGLCLQETQFLKLFIDDLPEVGNQVKFQVQEKNAQGLLAFNTYTSEVFHITYDPTKTVNPKCIVEVKGEKIEVDLYSVEKLQVKNQVNKSSTESINQLSFF